MKRVQLTITGLVQGVFFRKSTRRRALELGLTGWVRNETDGSVRAEVQGDEGDVHAMIEWCHDGPPNADVEQVGIRELEPLREESAFEIR